MCLPNMIFTSLVEMLREQALDWAEYIPRLSIYKACRVLL